MHSALRGNDIHPDTAHQWLKEFAPAYLLTDTSDLEQAKDKCRYCGLGACDGSSCGGHPRD